MANVGSVRYGVKVETEAVKRATRDVRRNLAQQRAQARKTERAWNDLNRSIGGITRRLGSLRSVAGLAIGGGAFGALIKGSAAAGAEVVELSAALGETVENTQKLQQAFEADGIAGEKVVDIFRRIRRYAVEAAEGNRRYVDSFRKLGITDIRGFARLGATGQAQALNRGASALGATERTAALSQIGVRDSRVIGLLGQEGRLDANLAHIEGLARVSDEAARNLKDLDQAISDLTNDAVKTLQEAVGDAAPAIIEFTEALRSQVPKLETAFDFAVGNLRTILETAGLLVGGSLVARGAGGALSAASSLATLGGAGKAAAALSRFSGPVSIAITGAVALTVLGKITQEARDAASRARGRGLAEDLSTEALFREVNRREGAGIGERVSRAYPAAAGYVRDEPADSPALEGFIEELERRFFAAPGPTQQPVPVVVEGVSGGGGASAAAAAALADRHDINRAAREASYEANLERIRDEANRARTEANLEAFYRSQPAADITGLLAGAGRVTARQNREIRGQMALDEQQREQERLWRAYENTTDTGRALVDTAYSAGSAFQALIRDLRDTGDETRTVGDKIAAFFGGLFDTFASSFINRQSNRLGDALLKLLPGFRTGGYAGPGLFVAGETGPELIASRRRVYVHNPAETRDLGRGGGSATVNLTFRVEAYTPDGFRRVADQVSEIVGSRVKRSLARDFNPIRGSA